MKAISVLVVLSLAATALGASVEYSYFQNPKTYGQDAFQLGVDTLQVNFDCHAHRHKSVVL